MVTNLFKKKVYLDHSATTAIHPQVAKVIKRYLKHRYANPSSAHESGLIARASIELARESIAKALDCSSEQLIFTGSGTESNNLALQGFLGDDLSGQHVITSTIEHGSITHTVEMLKSKGLKVSYVNVDQYGRYNLEHLEALIQPDTTSLFLSFVNSEIGTLQNVKALSEIAAKHRLYIHLDAVQALPYYEIQQIGRASCRERV